MKKTLLMICLVFLAVHLTYAQPVIETEGGSGIDAISVVIGLVIGLVVGYLAASRMTKK